MQNLPYQWLVAGSLIFLPFCRSLLAQSTTTTLSTHLTAVRQNQRPAAPASLWQNPEQHPEVLAALAPYYADTFATVRAQTYFLTKQVGTNSQDEAIRQRAVDRLTAGLRDEDSGISGRMHSYLTEFSSADFSPAARQSVSDLLVQRPAHLSQLLRLVGTLNLQEQTPTLRSLLPNLSARDRWAAQLALARLGDTEALATVLDRAQRYPVNDDVVYELLPDLIYIRQKDATDYLVTIVQSDEKNCESADPEATENIRCGYRVLELLAPVIQDFPLAVGESGDLAVDDYPQALQQARQWLKQHPDYQIISN